MSETQKGYGHRDGGLRANRAMECVARHPMIVHVFLRWLEIVSFTAIRLAIPEVTHHDATQELYGCATSLQVFRNSIRAV